MLQPIPTFERMVRIEDRFGRISVIVGIVLGISLLNSGCNSVFSRPVISATPQALPWFSNLAAAPAETASPFDLTLIQPTSNHGILPNDLLEVTIWDLYEPGKPHTFPSRVDGKGMVCVPHLDPISTTGISASEVEAQVVDLYRKNDVLKQPRVLIRELPSAPLHIYVTGAVQRPGLINLPRRSASVFAALVAVGGLSRQAGTHVFVSDQTTTKPLETTPSDAVTSASRSELPLVAGNSGLQLGTESERGTKPDTESARANQKTNSVTRFQSEPPPQSPDDLDLGQSASSGRSKPSESEVTDPSRISKEAAEKPIGIEESIVTRPDISASLSQSRSGQWYDLTSGKDRDQLKQLVLRDGDVITVRAAAQPVRITGAVAQPGPYRTPASNTLTIVEAIELAGGLLDRGKPVVAILTRPASSERGLQRWTFNMGEGSPLPSNAPCVQSGDLLHIEPTARARVQGVVDAFRPSKW